LRKIHYSDVYFIKLLTGQKILVCGRQHDIFIKNVVNNIQPRIVITALPNLDATFVLHDIIDLYLNKVVPCVHSLIVFFTPSEHNAQVPNSITISAVPEVFTLSNYADLNGLLFEFYLKMLMIEAYKQTPNFPSSVVIKIVEQFNKIKMNNSYSSSSRKNCIFLADNRKNPMSVVSTMLCLEHLEDFNDWQLLIATSDENKNWYATFFPFATFLNHDKMKMTRQFQIEDYNAMMKDSALWKQMLIYDKCLTIQDDGIIFKNGVERFLKWDYIGAPWFPSTLFKLQNNVGNGGLSIRSVQLMYEICCEFPDDASSYFNGAPIPEDVFFARGVEKKNGAIPSALEANLFSTEQIFNIDAIGIHKPWPYNSAQNVLSYFTKLQNMEST
jgi:hypothetical protein